MATSVKTNRVQQLAAEQKLIDGTKQYLSQTSSLTVGSRNVTPADIVQVFEGRIAKGKAAVAAADARAAAVKADRDERKNSATFVNAYKRIIIGMFLQSPDTLGVFGLKAPKVGKKSAAEKAATVVKVKATRTARGPLGSKNRAKVKGTTSIAGGTQPAAVRTLPAAGSAEPAATAPTPSAPTPTPSPSPVAPGPKAAS
jgi:hypothetical protein